MMQSRDCSHWRIQRVLNIASHMLGIVLAWIYSQQVVLPQQVEIIFYGSFMLLFLCSSLYHYSERLIEIKAETFFYKCDVSMIAVAVTGSCYAHAFVVPQIAWEHPLKIKCGLFLLSLIALIIIVLVFSNGKKTSMIVDSLFVLQVTLPTLLFPNWGRVCEAPMIALILGVICYGIGLIFVLNDAKHRYFHFIWHLWVLAGFTAHHFALVLSI